MQYMKVETAGDVRRWDSYIVAVPDDWDADAENSDRQLRDLIALGKGKHQGTDYEGEYDPVPPDEFEISEFEPTQAPAE
ncbi:hypothetical protein [Nocardia vermiculata]|uniref:Uncharacterized protein n=1 Tax=Nocardia vermiculata TaxID=257274 RepID=A0A846Y9H5_9NOCA|nr:hypothetical protein [Nocardia vermiculata]NKY53888.1 hypothetical protein [Nocardia vermiculata]